MLKKIIVASIVITMLTGCAQSKNFSVTTPDGVVHIKAEPFGLFNMDDKKDGICYSYSWGNAFISFLFIETVIVPVILEGFAAYEPIGVKPNGGECS